MRALVTGGGGFLGTELCKQLRAAGFEVISGSRHHHAALEALGVAQIRMDLGNREQVFAAAASAELVFHTASLTAMAGRASDFERINVEGTRHLLAACRAHGISRLVYTSTPSVVHAGTDLEAANEEAPYATHFLADYPRTKAIAEQEVLAANDEALATLALRPHLIWGPGDPHFVATLVERARAGSLRIVGDGSAQVDTVFVEDAAHAHLLAAEHLGPGAPCAGRAYFITQDEPRPVGELINGILEACGAPRVERHVAPGLAYAAGSIFETAHKLFRRPGVPRMTRFIARQLATSHWFDISAAKRDLGYAPRLSIDEALERLRREHQG